MIFKQQLTDISTVLNNTGNTTKLLISFNALDDAQQKVLLSSSLLSEKQKEQCITMATLSATNTKYTAEQLAKATGISTETLANWGLIESTDALTVSELAERAASDAQAKTVLDKIIAQNAEVVANGEITASNTALAASEGGVTLATGAFTTAIKANIKAMIAWMTTTPLGWLTMLVGGVVLAVKAYDFFTVSVEEANEAMDEAIGEYESAKSSLENISSKLEEQKKQLDELLAKDKLTYAEKGQLEELKKITKELLIQQEIEEKRTNKASKEAAEKTIDAYETQYGGYDLSRGYVERRLNDGNFSMPYENDIVSNMDAYLSVKNEYEKAQEEFLHATLNDEDTTQIEQDIQDYIDLMDEYSINLDDDISDLQEKRLALEDEYNKAVEKQNSGTEPLTTLDKKVISTYESISDSIKMIYEYTNQNDWNNMEIENIFNTEGIEKTKEELIEMAKAGELTPETISSYKNLNNAIEESEIFLKEGQTAARAFCDGINANVEATEKMSNNMRELKNSFPDRFQTLWNSEDFSDAQKDLAKLSKESGITAKDILSLARENSDLATLLDESGISAQFAATCFQRVCDGADGFSAITDDARALDQVLHEMDGSLQGVAASKSAYDKAMEQDDYNAGFKDYQDAYKSAMEMFENGDYGKHFRSAMEYLLGDDSYTMSIEELKNAMDGLKNVFGEGATNGLEFLDKLYEKKDILDGMGSSLEKLSDGSYDFDLKPEEFEKIGDALGMTKEEVAACTNALGMFGNYASYDIGELENTLKGMSVAAKDGKDSLLSLQGVQSMLSNMGKNGYEIYHIMQDIQGMDGIRLLDFSADDEGSLDSIISQLKELEMIEINGNSINVDSLVENLRGSFNMATEDIATFINSLNRDYNFEDAEGKALSLNEAITKAQTSENDAASESIDKVGESAEDAKDNVQELNSQKTTGIQGEFTNLAGKIREVANEILSVTQQVDTLNNKTLTGVTNSGSQGTANTMVTGKAGNVIKGTVKKITGKADASGNIGVKSNETALINELGNETIIDPKSGTYEVVEGGAQFRKLKKGQIVLNHLQTKALLAKGKIDSFGKMMFGGNASLKGKSYASGTAGGKNPATKKPYGNKSNDKSGSSKDSKDAKDETIKEFSEVFDWIERRIKKFQRSFDKWVKQAETAVTSNFVNKYYKKAQSSAKNQLSTYGKAYSRYMKEANAVGLDEKYARKVRNGTINIEEIRAKGTEEDVKKYEELADRIKEYQDWYDKAQDAMDSFLETAEKLYNLPLEKAARKVDIFRDAIDLLGKEIDNETDYTKKNKKIDRQTQKEKKILDANKAASTESKKSLSSAKKELRKNRNLNADDGITKKERTAIRKAAKGNKEVNLSYFKENSAGYKAAVKYNEALKARKKALNDAKSAQQDYDAWEVEASKLKFDNIADHYSKEVQMIGYDMSALDDRISEIEASGRKVYKSYYEDQKKVNAQKLAQYQSEKAALEQSIQNIKKGTDEWYDAYDQIQQVSSSISECTKETYELNDAISQLHFDMVDDTTEGIKRIITEQEFLRGLFAHEKNTDKKTGGLTDAGLANLGSLSAGYNLSKENASRLAAEVAELQRMLDAGETYSSLLGIELNSIDNVEKRLNEARATEQEWVKERYDNASAIHGIMEELYNAELDYLKELVDAKKEALDAEKDLHDYQKTISEKTEGIAAIQKQIAAYSGDTSEEGRAKLQRLQKELDDKKDDLKETEYDRYVSDQKEMLDDLYDEYSKNMEEKLEDFMAIVQEGLDKADDNMSAIRDFLGEVASRNGYEAATKGLFDSKFVLNGSDGTTSNTGIGDNAKDTASQVADREGKRYDPTRQETVQPTDPPFEGNKLTKHESDDVVKSNVKQYIGEAAIKAKEKKKEYSDVSQKVYENKAKSYKGTGKVLSTAAMKGLARLLGVEYDNASKNGRLYKKLKSIKFPGFRKGGVVSVDDIEKQVHENGDDGLVSVKNGEGILNLEQTEMMRKFAEHMPDFMNAYNPGNLVPVANPLENLKAVSNARSMNNVVNIENLALPNVTNYDEFKDRMFHDMQSDKKYIQFINDSSMNRTNGAGRLAKNRIPL